MRAECFAPKTTPSSQKSMRRIITRSLHELKFQTDARNRQTLFALFAKNISGLEIYIAAHTRINPHAKRRCASRTWSNNLVRSPGMELKDLSSNWRKLQKTLKSNTKPTASPIAKRKRSDNEKSSAALKKRPKISAYAEKRAENQTTSQKRKRGAMSTEEVTDDKQNKTTLNGAAETNGSIPSAAEGQSWIGKVNEGLSPTATVVKYLAMDCEMVGVGPNPAQDSALARASIVNYNGEQVYDSFVRPKERVTDWRTHVSGVTSKHMVDARSLETVQADVAKLMDDNILVGHAVRNDLDALMLSHPKADIRDTSRHPPFRKVAGGSTPRLKILAAEFLGLNIQEGQHSSVEDARATMLLFRHDKAAFNREHAKKYPPKIVAAAENDQEDDGKNGKKKRKPKKKTRKR